MKEISLSNKSLTLSRLFRLIRIESYTLEQYFRKVLRQQVWAAVLSIIAASTSLHFCIKLLSKLKYHYCRHGTSLCF